MAIPVWNQTTGFLVPRSFDAGMMQGIGGTANPKDPNFPCFDVPVTYPSGTVDVPAYFAKPEQIFVRKVYPFITIDRETFTSAMHRWMGVGQLEYRSVSGVDTVLPSGAIGPSGWQQKGQAIPYDFIYTISCFARYENLVQPILLNLLKAFPPIGTLIVFDSLAQERTYEAYQEGDVSSVSEIIDPVNRARGYSFTVRVEGEIDLGAPEVSTSVTGIDLFLHRQDNIS